MWNRDSPAALPDQHTYGSHPFVLDMRADGTAHGVLLFNSNGMETSITPDRLQVRACVCERGQRARGGRGRADGSWAAPLLHQAHARHMHVHATPLPLRIHAMHAPTHTHTHTHARSTA